LHYFSSVLSYHCEAERNELGLGSGKRGDISNPRWYRERRQIGAADFSIATKLRNPHAGIAERALSQFRFLDPSIINEPARWAKWRPPEVHDTVMFDRC
jgi:hypothetical protein